MVRAERDMLDRRKFPLPVVFFPKTAWRRGGPALENVGCSHDGERCLEMRGEIWLRFPER